MIAANIPQTLPSSDPWSKTPSSTRSPQSVGMALIRGAASLKLTVTLFGLAFILIVVGTLAQYEKNMWQVLSDYFRTYVAWVELHVFLPPTFFPHAPRLPGGFYFPGGKTIGILLMLNLMAAHAIRFRVQAKGHQRRMGWAITAAGLALTLAVILASSSRGGVQSQPLLSYDAYWQVLRLCAVAVFGISLYYTIRQPSNNRLGIWLQRMATLAAAGMCLVLIGWGGSQRLSDASMRILWQLGQSLLVAGIVLAGCLVLFKKRAGVVVIHLGVALLMLGELIVGMFAVEQRITLREGESTTFARQANALEVALVDPSDPKYDDVVVVPLARLQTGASISVPDRSLQLQLVEFYPNARLEAAQPGQTNLATAGSGRDAIAHHVRSAGGAEANQAEDIAAAYVRVSSADLPHDEVYLLSQMQTDAEGLTFGVPDRPEMIPVGDKSYAVSLRAKRNYKPYTIELINADSTSYLGTDRPKDYSSYINLTDQHGQPRLQNYRIWMNNPLRYGGETFYQSGFHSIPGPDGTVAAEATTLSVVSNQGWMIPYVACGYVLLGMLVHFGNTLTRFLGRQQAAVAADAPSGGGWLVPLGTLAVFATCVLQAARPPVPAENAMDLVALGRLPIVFEGRLQPIDTLARTLLKAVSNKQTFRALDGTEQPQDAPKGPRQSALTWLLDVAVGADSARTARVFRIENLATQQLLGIDRRKGLLYSLAEIQSGIPAFHQAVLEAQSVEQSDPLQLTNDQRKMIETAGRLRTFLMLQSAFEATDFPPLTQEGDSAHPQDARFQEFAEKARLAVQRAKAARQSGLPLIVPGEHADDWLPFGSALDRAYLARLMQGTEPNWAVVSWSQILDAYRRGNAQEFNRAVADYQRQLDRNTPAGIQQTRIDFEVLFNRVQPFLWCIVAYLAAFLLIVASWVIWHPPLRRAAFWLLVAAAVVHTLALMARMYISGRPPVTSLYSSAIFIGWGAVLFGLVLEAAFRLPVGNLLAAVAGFSTLLIAHNLGLNGDTFTVLQAVLDTQFWLATHVVCITLGYVAMFVAGLLAIAFIIGLRLPPAWLPARPMSNTIYGTICFAMFFSFLGTVLGGLWADDSWGRFWGWDPKENGALMIVLWNAIILHARWDGMIQARGMAVLAVLGNIVTAWSWFGVNELGIGLHSYGFTEGTLVVLGIFTISQLAIAFSAFLPPRPRLVGPVP